MSLEGRNIAILIAPRGTEEPEFTEPKEAVAKAGATVTVIGLEDGEAETVTGDLDPAGRYPVDRTIGGASAADFDGLIIPGGCVGADKLRASGDVIAFVHDFFAQGKPVGVICHGPWTLVEADVVKGRTLTSYPTVRKDIENAGGRWVDEECVCDQGLVTSRTPKDLPAFCSKIVEEFEEGRHPAQARSA
ncbi:type 1 glutamine amidotransferase [Methylobacterium sp. C25]|uniref:type 1 glutamine amidotransferase domain-containing protein n=1 Tax=Methylobacterium sp. C25 TaxID=2721622 RepID=UPI001F245D6A|nr:type 1 glutamine amidotransferase domain-containing protein [Methylobacterium sp. C25]MCE4226599.1 type 1 glutamine amidotransferase [Methylobacterium sp. C25]